MDGKKLDGKVAIVVGGATGIGRATAERMAHCGASVMIGDINLEGAQAAVAAIQAAGGKAAACRADVIEEADIQALVAETVKTFGGLNILHNNVALTNPQVVHQDGAVADMDVAIWDRVLAVNLRGPMLACKHALPHLIAAGGGAIVNTSSGLSLQGDLMPTAYAASKAGMNALTRSLAVQYGKQGVRANAVAVGLVASEAMNANFTPQIRSMMEEHHLTSYLGAPNHIAEVVCFLASDEAAYVTGHVMVADGGVSAHVPQLADFRRMMAQQP